MKKKKKTTFWQLLLSLIGVWLVSVVASYFTSDDFYNYVLWSSVIFIAVPVAFYYVIKVYAFGKGWPKSKSDRQFTITLLFTASLAVLISVGIFVSGFEQTILQNEASYIEEFPHGEIILSKKFTQQVQSHWSNANGKEYAGCLNGNIEFAINDTVTDPTIASEYHLTSVSDVHISQSSHFVGQANCTTNNIGRIHSHPRGTCKASDGDVKFFISKIQDEGNIFHIIQCESDVLYVMHRLKPGAGILINITGGEK